MRLDKFTIRSLELLQPMQDDGVSLLGVIDRTATPMQESKLKAGLAGNQASRAPFSQKNPTPQPAESPTPKNKEIQYVGK